MEAVRTSETSVDNHFTRQYIPEDNSDHTRRRENFKSHKVVRSLSKSHTRRRENFKSHKVVRSLSKSPLQMLIQILGLAILSVLYANDVPNFVKGFSISNDFVLFTQNTAVSFTSVGTERM
jgi:hypothetical protein